MGNFFQILVAFSEYLIFTRIYFLSIVLEQIEQLQDIIKQFNVHHISAPQFSFVNLLPWIYSTVLEMVGYGLQISVLIWFPLRILWDFSYKIGWNLIAPHFTCFFLFRHSYVPIICIWAIFSFLSVFWIAGHFNFSLKISLFFQSVRFVNKMHDFPLMGTRNLKEWGKRKFKNLYLKRHIS